MPTLTEVIFISQEWAETYVPRPGEAIISITDRAAPDAELKAGWHAVLRVAFDDVDPVESPVEPGEDLVELQVHQADRIATFVRDNHDLVSAFVVHCKYGQSRSAGVAKAIAQRHGLPFPPAYRHANNHVYELVLASLRRQGDA